MTGPPEDATGQCAPTGSECTSLSRRISLPIELVGSILGFLDLRDLRTAAAVGRQFYHTAWRAGLYIERVSSDMGIERARTDAAVWTELVEHALSKDLRLALTLECSCLEYQSEFRACIVAMLSAVSRSFPVLLALSIIVPDSMFHEACVFLRHPAPHLRSFTLSLRGCNAEQSISRSTGLFSGYAPRLREVGLDCPVVDVCALPIFASVTRVSADSWECSSPVSMSLHFPKLKDLYVISSSEDPEIPPPRIDLSGVTLASLAYKDTRWRPGQPCVARYLTRVCTDIPVLHHFCHDETFMDWTAPLAWPSSTRGSINLRLKGPSDELNMLVCPSDIAWRRSYIFQCFERETPIPLGEMPGLPARLKYLRLDDAVLDGFLQCDASLPGLRHLRIDVADTRMTGGWYPPRALFSGSATREYWCVRCPALEVLSLVGVRPSWNPRDEDADDLRLELSEIIKLLSTLGPADKPALELCEIRVDVPVGRGRDVTTLRDVFSNVEYLYAMPCAVFDGAVWDDNDAIVTDTYIRQSLAR